MDHNDRILVTGATSFIGGRLVEILAEQGLRIRVATSDFRNCSRVARFPVELVKANLLDHAALAEAVVGCSVVFHFAFKYGASRSEYRRANLGGTRALAEAFLRNGGRRFVHISSISAYGAPVNGDLNEDTPPQPTADVYSNTKLQIDRVLRHLFQTRGLPVTILQPTVVYGPYGGAWTTRLLEQVRSKRVVLPAGGAGLCNAVYVDDVAAACMLAVASDAAVGETFLVSGSEPVTWREFYGAYEKMLGRKAIVDLDEKALRTEVRLEKRHNSLYANLRRELAARPEARRYLLDRPPLSWLIAAARQLPMRRQDSIKDYYQSLWEPQSPADRRLPLYLPDPVLRALYAAHARVRIDKARKKLGYRPAFNLERGMALTREWAQWANLVPA